MLKTHVNTPEQEKLAGEIGEKRHLAFTSRRAEAAKKWLALEMYLGRDWAYIDQWGNMQTSDEDSFRHDIEQVEQFKYVHSNRVKPAADTVTAWIQQRQPRLTCYPMSGGQEAKNNARIGDDYLAYLRHKKDYLANDRECAAFVVITGQAYKWPYPFVTPDGVIEIKETVLNFSEVLPAPGTRRDLNASWIIIHRALDREFLQDQYEVKLKKGGARDTYGQTENKPGLLRADQRYDQKEVVEYFEPPTHDHERGRHIVMVDELILVNGDHPNWDNRDNGEEYWGGHRITPYYFDPLLTSHWCDGLVTMTLIDIANDINELLSCWITNRLLTLSVKLLKSPRLKFGEDELSNVPAVIDLPPNVDPPAYLDAPTMPADVEVAYRTLITAFNDDTGVHEIGLGKEPEQRMSGVQTMFLHERAISKFTPMFYGYAQSDATHAENILAATKQFAHHLFYRSLSSGRAAQVEEFLADDMKDMEVLFERGSSIPDSPAAQMETLFQLAGQTQLPMDDPYFRFTFFEAANSKQFQKFNEQMTGIIELAREENHRMMKGEIVSASIKHDHVTHMRVINEILDGPDYSEIQSTQTEQILMGHYQEHEQMVEFLEMKELQKQMNIQMMMAPPEQQALPPAPEELPPEALGPPPMELPAQNIGPEQVMIDQMSVSPLERQLLAKALGVPVDA